LEITTPITSTPHLTPAFDAVASVASCAESGRSSDPDAESFLDAMLMDENCGVGLLVSGSNDLATPLHAGCRDVAQVNASGCVSLTDKHSETRRILLATLNPARY